MDVVLVILESSRRLGGPLGRGFCFQKISIPVFVGHAHLQKIALLLVFGEFSQMAPPGKPLCSLVSKFCVEPWSQSPDISQLSPNPIEKLQI